MTTVWGLEGGLPGAASILISERLELLQLVLQGDPLFQRVRNFLVQFVDRPGNQAVPLPVLVNADLEVGKGLSGKGTTEEVSTKKS